MQTIDITKMVDKMTTAGIAKAEAVDIAWTSIRRYYSLRPEACCTIEDLQQSLDQGELAAMFNWAGSPDGHAYWASIYFKIKGVDLR